MKGVVGLLGVLFVALKLTGTISWSWIWVLAPFWSGFALFIVMLTLAILTSDRIKGRKSW